MSTIMTRDFAALLVDLDGTIADTADANFAAYAQACEEAGASIGREQFDRIAFGRNWRQFLPEIFGSDSAVDLAAVAARKRAIYPTKLALLRINWPLLSLIRSMRPVARTAMVTTASRGSVDAILAQFDIAPLFDLIVTGDDVAAHKPHPEAYLRAAELLAIDPADCLAFEDSDIGVASATAAGCSVIRVGAFVS